MTVPGQITTSSDGSFIRSMIDLDNSKPSQVCIRIDSPHVVVFKVFYRRPGEQWTFVGQGTDEDVVDVSSHCYMLPALIAASEISCLLAFDGNEGTAFKAQVVASQDGQIPDGGAVQVTGLIAGGTMLRQVRMVVV